MKKQKFMAIALAATMALSSIGGIVATASTKLSSSMPGIAAGGDFAFQIDKNNNIWAWGNNSSKQLTNAVSSSTAYSPTKILEDYIAVAGGVSHTLFVDSSGDLYSVGENTYGQLGHNKTITGGAPVYVLDGIVEVAAGDYHSMALDEVGNLYVWGLNNYSQLGNGKTAALSKPTYIMSNVKAIAADGNVSMALKTNGDLYVWGQNNLYQVGNGTSATQRTPVRVLTKVKAMATGGKHCLAVNTSGQLYAWGYGTYGQIGNGKRYSYSKPLRVNAGTLTSAGKAETTTLGKVKAVSAGTYHSAILLENGRTYAFGISRHAKDATGKLLRYANLKPRLIANNISGIESGNEFILLISNGGSIYSYGINDSGQLGNGKTDKLPTNVVTKLAFKATTTTPTPTPTPTPTTPTGPYNGATLRTKRTTSERGLDGQIYSIITYSYEGKAANGNPFEVIEVDYGTKEALMQVLDRNTTEFSFTDIGRVDSSGNNVPWEGYGVFLKDSCKLLYVRGTIDSSLIVQFGTRVTNTEEAHSLLGSTVGTGGGQTLSHRIYGAVRIIRSQDYTATGSDGVTYTYSVTDYQQITSRGTPFVIRETQYPSAQAVRALVKLDDVFEAPAKSFYLDDGTRMASNVSYFLSGSNKLIKTTDLSSSSIRGQLGTLVATPAEVYKTLGFSTDKVGDVITHTLLGKVKIESIIYRSATGSDGKTYSYVETTYVEQSASRPFRVVETDYGTKDAMRNLISYTQTYSFPRDPIYLSDNTLQNSSLALYVNNEKLYSTDYLRNVNIIKKLGTKVNSGREIYYAQGWTSGQTGDVGDVINHAILGQVTITANKVEKLVGSDNKTYEVRITTFYKSGNQMEPAYTVTETYYQNNTAMKALISKADFTSNNKTLVLSDGTIQRSSKAYYVDSRISTLYSTENLWDLSVVGELGIKVTTAREANNAVS